MLAEAILTLYNYLEYREKLARNAKPVYIKYKWENQKHQLFTLVKNVV